MVRSSARDSLFAPGVLKMQPSKLLGSEYPRWDVAELDAYGKRLAADAKRAAKKKKGGAMPFSLLYAFLPPPHPFCA